jgi:hypothetical protein
MNLLALPAYTDRCARMRAAQGVLRAILVTHPDDPTGARAPVEFCGADIFSGRGVNPAPKVSDNAVSRAWAARRPWKINFR